ncbi:hypothetical protein COCCADRAFT_112851, partial [Bipolaris zeicola 26-R-13]
EHIAQLSLEPVSLSPPHRSESLQRRGTPDAPDLAPLLKSYRNHSRLTVGGNSAAHGSRSESRAHLGESSDSDESFFHKFCGY